MKDSFLKLQDKTIVIAGPSLGITQSLATLLFEQGADVAFVGDGAHQLRKFAEGLMEQRQIHSHFGRIVAFEGALDSEKGRNDVLTRVVETLGSLDGLIDAHFLPATTQSLASVEQEESLQRWSDEFVQVPYRLAEMSLKFLKGRQKGRLVFLFDDLSLSGFTASDMRVAFRSALINWITSMAPALIEQNITINGVSVGVTEDQIKMVFPKKTMQEGLLEIKSTRPTARLIEAAELAPLLAFLLSPLSQSVTGQLIRANKGS